MTSQDRSVIDRCIAGDDETAWEDFVDLYQGVLRRGVAAALQGRRARRRTLEEDLLQETYCRLLERGARRLRRLRVRDETAVRAYLLRLARNVAIDHLRSRHAVKRGRHQLSTTVSPARVELAADRRPSVEERLILRQQGRRFLRTCRRAAAGRSEQRNLRILALAFLGGLTSREISQRLGSALTPGSIDSLVSRARKKLAREGFVLTSRRPSAPGRGRESPIMRG